MKIAGKKIEGHNIEICIIPRGNGEDIVFKCQAVLDMSDFDKLCPMPKVPMRRVAGKQLIEDVEDPLYKGLTDLRSTNRINYLIIKSLEATEDLEWETITMGDSGTWGNYEQELKDSGFSLIEIARIINTCMSANCLNEEKLQKARDAFLAGQAHQLEKHSILNGEQQNIPSGVPVSV